MFQLLEAHLCSGAQTSHQITISFALNAGTIFLVMLVSLHDHPHQSCFWLDQVTEVLTFADPGAVTGFYRSSQTIGVILFGRPVQTRAPVIKLVILVGRSVTRPVSGRLTK